MLETVREATLQALRDAADGSWIIDATVGAGGHARALLEALPNVRLLGLDQDPDALDLARQELSSFGDRAQLRHARISQLCKLLRDERFERPVAILADLGVSSMQIDRSDRGFSFQQDGPLDMRMDRRRDRTAADIINHWDESDLADLFYHEGDERGARRIAKAIVQARRGAPFKRTGALSDLIASSMGRAGGGGKIHPATRVFQALRRAVNEEGDEILALLDCAEYWLADRGLLAVISFHSGEDRVVKKRLAEGAREGRWSFPGKGSKPLQATHTERRANPRARSAKLRLALRDRSKEVALEEGTN